MHASTATPIARSDWRSSAGVRRFPGVWDVADPERTGAVSGLAVRWIDGLGSIEPITLGWAGGPERPGSIAAFVTVIVPRRYRLEVHPTGRSGSPVRFRRPLWVPESATSDAAVLLQARALRALGDGALSVVLVTYLTRLGLGPAQSGIVIALTLIGSAALTMAVGVCGHAIERRRLLRAVSLLMVATGIGFAAATGFWMVAVVAFFGTLNPSGGDVSVFLPTEQALLPATIAPAERTRLLARYSLIGTLVAAVGAAVAGGPEWLARHLSIAGETALRVAFAGYAVLGIAAFRRYGRLGPAVAPLTDTPRSALGPSKQRVYRLAVLFSIDSFGGGFVITALLVLWLQRRFDLSLAVSGAVFFWAGLGSALSQLAAPWLARRVGLVRTMVYTHLPANVLLVLTPFMPNATLAVACLLGRSALSQMDVPARTSYVMAMVTAEERPAAASITNVPRSLASALPPLAAGWMLGRTTFGWPLVIGGTFKIVYDLLLLTRFRHVRPPEEQPFGDPRAADG